MNHRMPCTRARPCRTLVRLRDGAALVALAALLAGCGGGGGGGGGGSIATPPAASGPTWTAGVYEQPSAFEARCAVPRTGTDPATGNPYADRAGSTLYENHWLRAWSHAYYLWYSELPDLNPANTPTTAAYFELLKTSNASPSGQPKDRFHFTYPSAEWFALSQSGVQVGYGAEWALLAVRPPRRAVVAYVQPGSPADTAGLRRGVEVLTVDGVDLVNAGDQASVDTLNAGLFPARSGESHSFGVRDPATQTTRTVTLTAGSVTGTPVQNVRTIQTPTGLVGYLTFNDHIATAEQQLSQAVNQLANAGITDLVLDLRYNGGGFLAIASELAYMIAGPGRTSGATFEQLAFNDKYPTTDPISGERLTPTPFYAQARGFSLAGGTSLPTLNLSRVFVLTGPGTCSASESIINGLRGVDVEVIQIGSTTCGKPYGFYPQDNCGTTYFTIQFKGVNAKGFGDYTDGFSPANSPGVAGVSVPGCSVADDFTHELGDPLESRLAAALAWRTSPSCPVASGSSSPDVLAQGDGLVYKSAFLTNRVLSRSR